MYGLKPTDIDALVPLRGAEMTQICIGPYDIQFNFPRKGQVAVWGGGRCELIDVDGEVVQIWQERTRSGMFRFSELLMSPVVDVAIDSPKSFVLRFENGMALRVVDNSEQYESFSFGNLFV
jgi:hypothetical protein